eukprot:Gregarina_sp_Poly_1__5185@NODE_274_length_10212_cov_70_754460_g239_i0_p1_GENE_NODE_274_length_10212_cov_70_754460_g239_i0NODE_274_length_10212_cov_70_754460_g239_i0_p1_ORF_typecomplete_len639_score112_39_NODE_274_length_10212_cov_70_754460_g239_i010152931
MASPRFEDNTRIFRESFGRTASGMSRQSSMTGTQRGAVSKVTGLSLAAGLHNGFIELVDSLDALGAVLASSGAEHEQRVSLREKTRNLIQTKGTQAIYWMQLMKEISLYAQDYLTQMGSVLKQRVEVLQAKGGGGETTMAATKQDPALPSYFSSIRILFESCRKNEISLDALQRAVENLIAERDATWEARVTKLHVYYGKVIDDMKFDFYKELEKAMISTRERTGDEERAINFERGGEGRFDLDELFEKLAKIGDQDELDKEKIAAMVDESEKVVRREPTKEKYMGTSSSLKIIVPPKLATVEFPRFPGDRDDEQHEQDVRMFITEMQQTQGGSSWCGPNCSMNPQLIWSGRNRVMPLKHPANNMKTYKFHLTFPQQEIRVPFHVIDRYARDVLYKDLEIIPADDPRLQSSREPVPLMPEVNLQVIAPPTAAEPEPDVKLLASQSQGEPQEPTSPKIAVEETVEDVSPRSEISESSEKPAAAKQPISKRTPTTRVTRASGSKLTTPSGGRPPAPAGTRQPAVSKPTAPARGASGSKSPTPTSKPVTPTSKPAAPIPKSEAPTPKPSTVGSKLGSPKSLSAAKLSAATRGIATRTPFTKRSPEKETLKKPSAAEKKPTKTAPTSARVRPTSAAKKPPKR